MLSKEKIQLHNPSYTKGLYPWSSLNHEVKRGCPLIISTTKGLMTDKEARQLKLGGEVVAYIE